MGYYIPGASIIQHISLQIGMIVATAVAQVGFNVSDATGAFSQYMIGTRVTSNLSPCSCIRVYILLMLMNCQMYTHLLVSAENNDHIEENHFPDLIAEVIDMKR